MRSRPNRRVQARVRLYRQGCDRALLTAGPAAGGIAASAWTLPPTPVHCAMICLPSSATKSSSSQTHVMRALPGLLDEVARDTELGSQLFDAFVAPRRR